MVRIMTVNDIKYREDLFRIFYSALPQSFKPTETYTQIRSAYDLAFTAHHGVRRKGGNHEPYITHPISVALIVANEIGLGVSSVIAALLHDVIEDTEFTKEDIAEKFGNNIANIVEGLTKITNVYDAKKNAQSETFKKMLLSIPHDPRVAFIKIADRLHNMRTMEDMPDGTRQIKAAENLFVYVPIADQLGLFDIKNELEDTSFKYSHPGTYIYLKTEMEKLSEKRKKTFESFKLALMKIMVGTQWVCKFSVIEKSCFQIWKMMQEAGISFSEVENSLSLRVIFDAGDIYDAQDIVNAHYNIYSSIIANFAEREGFKRDYVVRPKSNGFKALVFMVMFEGNWIEIQILTNENDMVAHCGYSKSRPNRIGLDTLQENIKSFNDSESAIELINRFRTLSNLEKIFVFTPKGNIIELPKNATVLDFAYAIHSRIGNHCTGAIIGGEHVQINYVLKSTDQVNVTFSPSVRPSKNCYSFIKSDHTKNCLDKYFKNNPQNDNSEIIKGRQIINNLLCDKHVIPSAHLIGRILSHYELPNTEELYRCIAKHEISENDIWSTIKGIKTIIEGKNTIKTKDIEKPKPIKVTDLVEIDYRKPLLINQDLPYVLSPCCRPISGDDAVVCRDEDGVLYIHKRECETAKQIGATDGKHTTTVRWGKINPALAALNLEGVDRECMIADISSKLSKELKLKIKSIEFREEGGLFKGKIVVYVDDTLQLEKIQEELLKINGLVKINRINQQKRQIIIN